MTTMTGVAGMGSVEIIPGGLETQLTVAAILTVIMLWRRRNAKAWEVMATSKVGQAIEAAYTKSSETLGKRDSLIAANPNLSELRQFAMSQFITKTPPSVIPPKAS